MQVSERSQKLREYYYCDDFKEVRSEVEANLSDQYLERNTPNELWNDLCYDASQRDWDTWQKKYSIRQELTNKSSHGLAYVTMWIAGWSQDSTQWNNFFAVRTKNPSQKEIQELATVMKGMIDE
jgi:thymidylate synthase ThyX